MLAPELAGDEIVRIAALAALIAAGIAGFAGLALAFGAVGWGDLRRLRRRQPA